MAAWAESVTATLWTSLSTTTGTAFFLLLLLQTCEWKVALKCFCLAQRGPAGMKPIKPLNYKH